MRARHLLAVMLAGALFAPTAVADPVGRRLEVTPFVGYTVFDGEHRVGGNPLTNDLYYGGRVAFQFHRLWAIEGALGYTPTAEDGGSGADVDFYHYSGNLVMTPWPGLFGGLYVFVGGGSAQVNPNGGGGESNGGIEAGGGVKLWLTDRVGLRLEMRQINYTIDPDVGITHLVAGGGLTFALGAKGRDTDGDGVSDRTDACADTPRGARVDAKGCPMDTDGDLVLDGIDQCEATIKGCTVDAKGCPSDPDADGVCDGLDQCADTPVGATVDAKGCPGDSDGDGVFDGIDSCAATPKGATVDAKGCPSDSDGDGVPEGLDQCPETAQGLKVDEKGCPIEVMEMETELLDTGKIRVENVHFETAKATLLPESFPVLQIVGEVLKKWPELKFEIGGHTDNRGADRYNQKLSEARAESVRSHLTQTYPELKPEQYVAKGYGESRPVVPNNSDPNMAKNRRVEFVVLNKDVLRRETQRRRLLQKGEALPDTTKTPAMPDTSAAPPDTTRR